MSAAITGVTTSPDDAAAREGLAHRLRRSGILDVEGPDRVAFLQGQLTQDVKTLAAGETRQAAALTPKGKLVFIARLLGLPDRIRLLLPEERTEPVREHLKKYVIFQRVAIVDRSRELSRVGLYGPRAGDVVSPAGATRLPGEGEFSSEILLAAERLEELEKLLRLAGSTPVSEKTAEVLRVEAGRPRFGQDADSSNLADEVGLDTAVSTTKGCYVGQEIVARMRTYGRVNRRLVGFRFPDGPIEPGAVLKLREEPQPGRVEQGRVTSGALSPLFGAIGLGYAFREVPEGGQLVSVADPSRRAIVTSLPFRR